MTQLNKEVLISQKKKEEIYWWFNLQKIHDHFQKLLHVARA